MCSGPIFSRLLDWRTNPADAGPAREWDLDPELSDHSPIVAELPNRAPNPSVSI